MAHPDRTAALGAIMSGMTIPEAARAARTSESSIKRLKKDPVFAQELALFTARALHDVGPAYAEARDRLNKLIQSEDDSVAQRAVHEVFRHTERLLDISIKAHAAADGETSEAGPDVLDAGSHDDEPAIEHPATYTSPACPAVSPVYPPLGLPAAGADSNVPEAVTNPVQTPITKPTARQPSEQETQEKPRKDVQAEPASTATTDGQERDREADRLNYPTLHKIGDLPPR